MVKPFPHAFLCSDRCRMSYSRLCKAGMRTVYKQLYENSLFLFLRTFPKRCRIEAAPAIEQSPERFIKLYPQSTVYPLSITGPQSARIKRRTILQTRLFSHSVSRVLQIALNSFVHRCHICIYKSMHLHLCTHKACKKQNLLSPVVQIF